jgi:hypothetical protein
MTDQPENEDTGRGPGSFCIPRKAMEALLDAEVTAYEICTYLVLARFTDETGQYATASISAVNRYTGANKLKGGPVDRAIERLKTIRAKATERVSNGLPGKRHAMVDQVTDLGPILFSRDAWLEVTAETLPDGPTERGRVLFILPHFGEPLEARIWFGGNLVIGVGEFHRPLKALKDAGDVAARLLLSLYAANDMETWGGVRPTGPGRGPCKRYEPVGDEVRISSWRLIRAADRGEVASMGKCIGGGSEEAYWEALLALASVGLTYEVVMVLNRNARPSQFASGEPYGAIPEDAEPLYELDCRNLHGYKPEGEEGIGGATANTAGALGYSVATEGGHFDGTYAAFVPTGFPAMIAGIYRLRFRVANPKNAGVKGAWARIYHNNSEYFELINRIRAKSSLPLLRPPWEKREPTEQAPPK